MELLSNEISLEPKLFAAAFSVQEPVMRTLGIHCTMLSLQNPDDSVLLEKKEAAISYLLSYCGNENRQKSLPIYTPHQASLIMEATYQTVTRGEISTFLLDELADSLVKSQSGTKNAEYADPKFQTRLHEATVLAAASILETATRQQSVERAEPFCTAPANRQISIPDLRRRLTDAYKIKAA
jgi:hypothetical protein